jgi:hypothetical protein
VAARRGVIAGGGDNGLVLVMCFSLETRLNGQSVIQDTSSGFRVRDVAQTIVFQCETGPVIVEGHRRPGDLEQTFRKVRLIADSFAAGSRQPP